MALKTSLAILSLLLLLFSLSACIQGESSTPGGTIVEIPANVHNDLVRLPDGELLVRTDNWTFYALKAKHFVEAHLPDNPDCTRRTDYLFPTGLPDGRLGLLQRCLGRWPNRVAGKDDADYIFAYDWENRTLEKIVDVPLDLAYRFSWNPEMTRGVQEFASLRGSIAWITDEGILPITVTIGTGDDSWSLDENFAVFDVLYYDDVGIARRPSWSPDGEVVAFWASTSVIGQSGQARARGVYSLYLLDPGTLNHHSILDDVRNPEDLVWSPNSDWLLFQGVVAGRDGLWLIKRDGSTLERVDRVSMEAWNWINNQEVLAIQCLSNSYPCTRAQLVKYDVTETLASP